jgi:hypothetical protein
MSLDNSASVLPDYIEPVALKGEAGIKITEFLNNRDNLSEEAILRAAKDESGAKTALQTYKTKMENVIHWYEGKNEELKRALKAASSSSSDYATLFNTKKAEVDSLKESVQKQAELEKIRQEQVASLANREAANYHTSWLGLQRPMKEGSRLGLLVAAGFFALLAIVGLVYIYRLRAEGPGFGSSFGFGFFTGGRHRRSCK